MSRLIDIDLQVQLESEPEGYEFGYYTFDTLPTLEVSSVETPQNTSLDVNKVNASNSILLNLPIDNNSLSKLQQKDLFCNNILTQIEKGNIIETYMVKDKLLKRYVIDGNNTYETTVIPRAITAQVLQMVHDHLGHNGTHRTYTLPKKLYYWKGLKPSVEKHIKMCYQCQRRIDKLLNMQHCISMWPLFQCNSFLWI